MTEKTGLFKKSGDALKRMTGKALGALQNFTVRLDPMIEVPFVGDTIKEVQDIVYMLNDYYLGNYKQVPVTAIVGGIMIIGYLASPIDLVPDSVPILGLLDDAFIINIIIELCIDKELKRYRSWRKMQSENLLNA